MVHFIQVLKSEVFLRGQKRIFKRNKMGRGQGQNEWPINEQGDHGEAWHKKQIPDRYLDEVVPE